MFDIFLESVGSIIAAVIFWTLLRGTQHHQVRTQPGSQLVVIGFGLLLFSSVIDITDNFPSLNSLLVVGDTEFQAFLEKVIGMLLGLFLLALGFRRWIPSIQDLEQTRNALNQLTLDLDKRVQKRTIELQQANKKLSLEILERQKAEEQLKFQALHDSLTLLPNRHALNECLEHEMIRATRHNYFCAVLFLDLDDFKSINDMLGHETGDLALKVIAERLEQCQRKEDFLGRLGGDEFVLVLTELNPDIQIAAELVQAITQQITHILNEPILLSDHKLSTSSCIGIKLFPGTKSETVGDLLRQADIALYHAKNKGPGEFSFFHEDMQKLVEQRLNLARDLHDALEQEQLFLHYQPQMTNDGQVFGVEALLRWNHPKQGMIGPNEFIPIAEEAGLIDKLGRYVMHQALAEWSCFLANTIHDDHLKVAVNISPNHFLQADFVSQVKDIINAYDLQNCHLVLEITEGVVIQDITDISAKMDALRQLDIGISLDDFGTGYSSLAYIKRLPLDTLKIDQSFVRDIHVDSNDEAIVEAILAMAASLGVNVIAEGVETEEQYNFLQQRGCKLYQGYWFSRPAPLCELIENSIFTKATTEEVDAPPTW
ncbi:MAG: EAL domain-containing protein [Amphritea sp.]